MISPQARLAALKARAAERFHARFGREATLFAVGPGRVNLIGEHVDYNDGFVLPMAIERHVLIAADAAEGRRGDDQQRSSTVARLASAEKPDVVEVACDQPIEPGEPSWANYVRGVMAGFQQRGVTVPGFDAFIDADLPLGGGLSSSAALEVSTATLLEALTHVHLDPVEKALLCQTAEHHFAGVPCGIMDQFASVMGRRDHLLLLDCRSRQVRFVPLSDPSVTVLIINTNVKHELGSGEYAKRRRECEIAAAAMRLDSLRDATMTMLTGARQELDKVVFRRARHVITEIARTQKAAEAVQADDWRAVGGLMYQSHASLRDDFEVSCAELDALVEIAAGLAEGEGGDSLRDSVIGCRMTGGGFGGCAVCLVHTGSAGAVSSHLERAYRLRTGIAASHFTTRPAEGARLLG